MTSVVHLMGTVRLVRDGQPVDVGGPKQQAVLAVLALSAGRRVSTDRLVDLVWDQNPPASARRTVQSYVASLRRVLGAGAALEPSQNGYTLNVDRGVVDLLAFEDRAAGLLGDVGLDPDDKAQGLAEVLSTWETPLDGLRGALRLGELAAPFEELRFQAVEGLAAAQIAGTRAGDAVKMLEALVREYPTRENLWLELARGLNRLGRRDAALNAIQRAREALREHLGVHPSALLSALETDLLTGQAEPLARSDGDEPGGVRAGAKASLVTPSASFVGRTEEIRAISAPSDHGGVVDSAQPSGTVTFLFTDVEGSTRLWAADSGAMSMSLLVHDAVLRSAIESTGGYVFTTAGDSFAAAFSRASDAVSAALAIQAGLADAVWPGPRLRVRVGMHLGEAEERGGDYFGPVVNTAARVEAAGHGGQTLITDAVRTAARVEATDLGVHRLRDVNEPMLLFQVGDGAFPALRALDSAPESNLSVRPTRLIGRTTEVAEARQALVTHRLVTVSAVGGSGKTRLAVEVGEQELNHRSGGVWFVDLTSALSSGDVAPAVAAATRLRLTAGDPTEQVVSFFADKASLVILDNCEHVIDGCAEFAEAMLAAPGETVLLATSREALDVDGEQVMHLGSLTATGADGPSGKRSPAVELFVERAIAIDPSFSMTGESASTVAELCERLDGMPLAIELAAARVTVMSPDELLAGLEDRFNLLSGGRRRQRQRTLEATLDWSYNLLDADLQRVFRALGVFVGGFDIDAVAATADITRTQSIDAIEALVAKSLVVRTESADVSRFGLLETLKAYSEDRLIQAGEAASVRDRHAAHFHRVATVWGRILGPDVRVGRRLRHDHSNLSAAIDWFANNDQWVAAGELLLGAHASYQSYGSSAEAVALGHRVETPLDNIDPALADFIRASEIGALAVLADFVAAIATAEQLLESESLSCRVEGFQWLGFFWAISSPSTSMQLVEQARRDADTTQTDRPDPNIEAALAGLEFVELAVECYTGDYQNALDRTSRWVDEISQDGVLTSMDLAFVQTRAGLLVLLGDPANALAQLDEFADYPFQFGVGGVRALAHLALGDIDAARERTRLEAAESMAGRLRMQANETVLVLAALAEVEGERNVSIDLVLKMGVGPSPIATASGRELASRLGVGDSYAAQLGASLDPSGDDFIGVRTAMTALRAEVARRGW